MADQLVGLVVTAVELGFKVKEAYDQVKENDASRNDMVDRAVHLLEELESLARSLPNLKGDPHAPGMRLAVRDLQRELRDALAKLDSLAPSGKARAIDKFVGPVKDLITAHTVDSALTAVERQIKICLAEFTATQALRNGIALSHLKDQIDKLSKKVAPSQAHSKKAAPAGNGAKGKGKATNTKPSPNATPAKKAAPAPGKSPTSDNKQSKLPKNENKPPASSKPSPKTNAGKKRAEKAEKGKAESKPSPRPSEKPKVDGGKEKAPKDDKKTGNDKAAAGNAKTEGSSKSKWSGKGKEHATAGKGRIETSTTSKAQAKKPQQQSDGGKASSSDTTFPSKNPPPVIVIHPAALARQPSDSSAISASSASSGLSASSTRSNPLPPPPRMIPRPRAQSSAGTSTSLKPPVSPRPRAISSDGSSSCSKFNLPSPESSVEQRAAMLESAYRTVHHSSKGSESKQAFAIARELVGVRKTLYDDMPSVSNTHKLALALTRFASSAAQAWVSDSDLDSPGWEDERLDALKYSSDLYAVLCGHDSSFRADRAEALLSLSKERSAVSRRRGMVPMKIVEDDAKAAVDIFRSLGNRHVSRLANAMENLSSIQSERDDCIQALATATEAIEVLKAAKVNESGSQRKVYSRIASCYRDLGQTPKQKEYEKKARQAI